MDWVELSKVEPCEKGLRVAREPPKYKPHKAPTKSTTNKQAAPADTSDRRKMKITVYQPRAAPREDRNTPELPPNQEHAGVNNTKEQN